jgi:hypothetical protein
VNVDVQRRHINSRRHGKARPLETQRHTADTAEQIDGD